MNNFEALDYIRNTVVGHIFVDFRIACEMCNLTQVSFNPDGKRSRSVAKPLRKKLNIQKNNLIEFILKKHFDTKAIPSINFFRIDDFPKLSRKKFKY